MITVIDADGHDFAPNGVGEHHLSPAFHEPGLAHAVQRPSGWHVPKPCCRVLTRRRIVAVSLLGLIGSAAVACSAPAAPPTPAPAKPTTGPAAATSAAAPRPTAAAKPAATAPPAAKQPVKWQAGTLSAKLFNTAFQYMPLEKGFFKAEGLDVEYQGLVDATAIKALVAGEIQSFDTAPNVVLEAIEQGADLRILGTTNPLAPFVFLVKKDISSLRDLYGRTVGIPAKGSALETLVLEMLRLEKLDPKQMEWFSVQQGGTAALYQALVAGKVDAQIATIDQMFEAEKNPDVKVLTGLPDVMSKYIRLAVVVTAKTLRERRAAVVGFCTAYTRGVRYCLENKQETVALAGKITGLPDDQNARAFDWYVENKAIEPNFLLTPAQIEWVQDLNLAHGKQQKRFPIDQVATWDVQKAVIAQLGEHKK